MTLLDDSFTGDVLRLLQCVPGGREEFRRQMLATPCDDVTKAIQLCVCAATVHGMEDSPLFAKELVARALLGHVDWKAVAAWAMTDPGVN